MKGWYSAGGNDWRLAYSLQTLAAEIDKKWPGQVTCLGTLGDARHRAESTSSHNPTVRHDGQGIVRAIDLNASDAILNELEHLVNKMYNAHDPRVYRRGYTHRNGRITVWDDNTSTSTKPQSGDQGHLHISVSDTEWPAHAGSYNPAVDSRSTWLFHAAPAPHPAPATPPNNAPATRTYTVRRGDNLSSIARHLHTTVSALAKRNHISNPNKITVGQHLHY